MRNGAKDFVLRDLPEARASNVRWVADLMASLRPGGMWVMPRTITTVLVLSKDPPIAQYSTIFPNPSLPQLLDAAGWTVQKREIGESA